METHSHVYGVVGREANPFPGQDNVVCHAFPPKSSPVLMYGVGLIHGHEKKGLPFDLAWDPRRML